MAIFEFEKNPLKGYLNKLNSLAQLKTNYLNFNYLNLKLFEFYKFNVE